MANRIFTVGHSNHKMETFLSLLCQNKIQYLVDVRRFPQSRKHPQFNQDELTRHLQAAGINYVYLGTELGGYRSGGYQAHMKTEVFSAGIAALVELSSKGTVCLMCAEKDPRGCHRRRIGDYLQQEGIIVSHILENGQVAPHQSSLL